MAIRKSVQVNPRPDEPAADPLCHHTALDCESQPPRSSWATSNGWLMLVPLGVFLVAAAGYWGCQQIQPAVPFPPANVHLAGAGALSR